jgi:hypothetical protein
MVRDGVVLLGKSIGPDIQLGLGSGVILMCFNVDKMGWVGGGTVEWWRLSAERRPSLAVGRCWDRTWNVAGRCGFYRGDFYCRRRG